MGLFDKLLGSIRLNDDFDEDDDFFDEEEFEEEKPAKKRKSLFGRKKEAEDDFDDFEAEFDDDFDDGYKDPKPAKKAAVKEPAKESFKDSYKETYKEPAKDSYKFTQPKTAPSSKVTPMRKKDSKLSNTRISSMEVCVIKPASMEDTREIADTLLANCTVVLNLEGIDVEVAQRIIDFTSGACYSVQGSLQKVSSYIFILTPNNVEISGDIQDILNGNVVPSIRTEF